MNLLRTVSAFSRLVKPMLGWTGRDSETCAVASQPDPETAPEPIFRLRHWPTLPAPVRTAEVLRLLSLMSHRPVNRSWVLSHTRMNPAVFDRLLLRLQQQNAVEVIDPSGYARHPLDWMTTAKPVRTTRAA